jgi:hypothetical protein
MLWLWLVSQTSLSTLLSLNMSESPSLNTVNSSPLSLLSLRRRQPELGKQQLEKGVLLRNSPEPLNTKDCLKA